ncbi:MAG: hypothetical protein KDK78_10170, partial [Chlamydiia bacterium]|nr:hypothetical protein [Chlamydiia bacterium]
MDERGAMTCQLCGHENRYDVQDCALCGATLHLEGGVQAVPDEAIDVSQTRVSTRRLAVTLLLLAACALPWYLMCDLFQVPVEVVASRKAHAELKKRYAQNPTVWGKQKDQIVAVMQAPMALSQHIADDLVFDSLPLEVLEAYVEEDLGLNAQRYPSLCWYLRPDSKRPTFILSKYEGKGGPFAVTLSLEAAIQSRGDSISIDILRLRRGSREIAPSLT